MVIDVIRTYWDHLAIHRNIESLCILKLTFMLCINYIFAISLGLYEKISVRLYMGGKRAFAKRFESQLYHCGCKTVGESFHHSGSYL